MFLQTEGRLAGCWVMRSTKAPTAADEGDGGRRATRKNRAKKSSSVPTASSPTSARTSPTSSGSSACSDATSATAASATQTSGAPLWATTSDAGEPAAPPFGRAGRIYNVIDSRQMYLQALLSQALRALGHPQEAENSIHFSYEMVALSHATARELGYDVAAGGDEAAKPFVEVSGRKGLGVKIDDLLDLLTDEGRGRSRQAQSRVHGRGVRARCVADCRRGHPLLHAEVLARQADRVRHRGGAQLRGRNGPVPAVCCRPREQHLPQAPGTGRPQRGRRARRPRRRGA